MPSRLRHCVVQKSSAPWACRSLRGGRNRKCGNRKIFAVWGNDAQLTKMSRIYNNTSLQNKPVHSEKVERIWSPSAYERYGFKLCSWQWDCKCCWRHVVAPNCAWIVWIGQNSDNSALNWRFTNILVLGFKSVSLSAVIVINLVDVFAVMGAWQRHLPSFTWTTIQSSDRCQAPAAGIKGTVCHFKLLTGCNVFFFSDWVWCLGWIGLTEGIFLLSVRSGEGVLLEGKLLDVSRHAVSDDNSQKVPAARYQ